MLATLRPQKLKGQLIRLASAAGVQLSPTDLIELSMSTVGVSGDEDLLREIHSHVEKRALVAKVTAALEEVIDRREDEKQRESATKNMNTLIERVQKVMGTGAGKRLEVLASEVLSSWEEEERLAHRRAMRLAEEEERTRKLDMDAVTKYMKDGVEEMLRLVIYDLGGQRVFYTRTIYSLRVTIYFTVFVWSGLWTRRRWRSFMMRLQGRGDKARIRSGRLLTVYSLLVMLSVSTRTR